jgi:uncharacterized protein (DUF2141 family)
MKLVTLPDNSIYKTTLLVCLFLFVNTLNFAQVTKDTSSFGKLKVIITGFESNDGNCRFALDNSEYIYESEDTVWIGKVLPIEDKQVVVVIDSLKYGEYAIRVFHDENKNGKIDTNILGIPTEDYGYSNDASGWFGPPSWEKAKFIIDKSEMTITIKVD